MRLTRSMWVILGAAAGAIVMASAAVGLGGNELRLSTASGGGGSATGGSYSLRSSMGQPDAGSLSSGGYTLRGGVLSAAAPAGPIVTATAPASPTASATPGAQKRYAPFVATDGAP